MHKLITPYASEFGKPNVVIQQFPDTESYVFIPKVTTLKNKKVTIFHRLYPDPDKRFFELLLILSRITRETKNIELFAPYLPYARQDKEHEVGDVISADVICGLLKYHGIKKLITYDCHFLPGPGMYTRNGLRIENRSAGAQLLSHAKKYFGKEKFITISPDQGSSYFIENAQGYSLHKKRSRLRKGEVDTEVKVIEKETLDVKGKNICILDDIIATGGTIMRAAEHLKKLGARKIIVGAVHGVFCGEKIAEKILKSGVNEVFVMNSILPTENLQKVKVLSLPKN